MKNCLEPHHDTSGLRLGRGWNKGTHLSGMKGKKHTEEWKSKMSSILKGRTYSDETLRRMSLGHIGEKHSEERRRNMSEAHKGEKSYSWRGGITSENKRIRRSLEMRLWRETVFKRDNYSCVWCGVRSGKGQKVILHADHIKQFAYYPELRFVINNGRTLCKECHKKTPTFNKRQIEVFTGIAAPDNKSVSVIE